MIKANSIYYELEQQFKEECKVIDLQKEYSQYAGTAKWAIASSLSEADLRNKYAPLLEIYEPFVYMTHEQYEPILQYRNNDRKYIRRYSAHHIPFTYEDDFSERCNPELIINFFEGKENWSELYDTIARLAPTQRARIQKYFFEEVSLVDIAAQEKVSVQAVQQSVARSLATMKKILEAENFDPLNDPLWE